MTVGETIAQYEGWLHRRAHQLVAPLDDRHDDLVQEGRIAMWEAFGRHDPARGALPAWLTRHAVWRMKDILARREGWTGAARAGAEGRRTAAGDGARARIVEAITAFRREHGSEPSLRELAQLTGLAVSTVQHHRQRLGHVADEGSAVTVGLEDLLDADVVGALSVPDVAEQAMWAYHEGEIAAAVAGLTEAQRRYVRLRFWEDASGAELVEEFGYHPKGLWKKARGGAQPQLARVLEHLGETA